MCVYYYYGVQCWCSVTVSDADLLHPIKVSFSCSLLSSCLRWSHSDTVGRELSPILPMVEASCVFWL